MKTSALESLFNKVVDSFIKKRLQHRCFPLNIANFLRTTILKNIYKRLLLMGLWCNSLALHWKPLTIITKSSILDVAAILEYHSHKNGRKSFCSYDYDNTLQRVSCCSTAKTFWSCFSCGRKGMQSSVLFGSIEIYSKTLIFITSRCTHWKVF